MKDLFVSCPFHGIDKTPSLSIVLQDKGNLKAGFAHCFSCGWTGNYRQVEEALGYPLDIAPQIRQQLEEGGFSHTRKPFGLRTVRMQDTPSKTYKKEELPFKFSPYLKKRGIGEVVQRANKVYENGHLNMPFFDPFGTLLGSIERSTDDSKFYKVNGNIQYPLGIEQIKISDFVYVTEGSIDKMTLEEVGFKAVALGSVSNYRLLRFLKNFNICFAFDNDDAGQKVTELAFQYIIQNRRPNLYSLKLPKEVKDINQLWIDMRSANETTGVLYDFVRENTERL